MRRHFATLGLAAACCVIIVEAPARAAPATAALRLAEASAGQIIPGLKYQGIGGCARRSCHGGEPPPNPRAWRWHRHEYSYWIVLKDRHAQAYNALYNEASQQIAANLGLSRGAHETKLCLDCHSLNPPADQRGPRFSNEVGVSCETCHGPSEKWWTIHAVPGGRWSQLTNAQKEQFGMRNLHSISTRVKLCTHCHVGDRTKGVNHDLLAAGHPPLDFEAASFHDRMPKHWDFATELRGNPMLQPRLWLAGQAASAGALADVVAGQADGGNWPEFAYYNCSSCHHSLQTTINVSAATSGQVGQAEWGQWEAMFVGLAQRNFSGLPGEAAAALSNVQRSMGFYQSDRRAVVAPASAAADRLRDWSLALAGQDFTPGVVDRLAASVLNLNGGAPHASTARHRFLALRALTDYPGSRLADPMLKQLAEDYDKQLVNPRNLDLDAVEQVLSRIRERVQAGRSE